MSGVSDRQIAFVNQRHVTTEKLEAAICEVINGYNRFWLPKLWGDAKRAAADGTLWDLYENNMNDSFNIGNASGSSALTYLLTLPCCPFAQFSGCQFCG